MTTHPLSSDHPPPKDLIADLIARHGVMSVLWALGRALIPGQQARSGATALTLPHPMSAHLARDIGIGPQTQRRDYRDLR